MNKQSRQQFMTLFNDILAGKKGGSLNGVMQTSDNKGDEIDLLSAQKEQALNMRLDQRNVLFLKKSC